MLPPRSCSVEYLRKWLQADLRGVTARLASLPATAPRFSAVKRQWQCRRAQSGTWKHFNRSQSPCPANGKSKYLHSTDTILHQIEAWASMIGNEVHYDPRRIRVMRKVLVYVPCPHVGAGQWREAYRDDLIEAALWRLKSTALGEHVACSARSSRSRFTTKSAIEKSSFGRGCRGERGRMSVRPGTGQCCPSLHLDRAPLFSAIGGLQYLAHACISVSRFLNKSPRW